MARPPFGQTGVAVQDQTAQARQARDMTQQRIPHRERRAGPRCGVRAPQRQLRQPLRGVMTTVVRAFGFRV